MQKTFFKRTLAVVLVLVMLVGIIPVASARTYQPYSRTDKFRTVTLTDNPAENMARIAQAQEGLTGAYFAYGPEGGPVEQWCADFVSDCGRIAGITHLMPPDCGAQHLCNNILASGGYKTDNPQRGDIVFFQRGYNIGHVEVYLGLGKECGRNDKPNERVFAGGNVNPNPSAETTAATRRVVVHAESEFDSSSIACFVHPNYGTEPEHKHNFVYDHSVAATCTQEGYTVYKCSCGETKKGDIIPALGHDFSNWSITKQPTCTQDGEITYYCLNCSATKTEKIPATGEHEWDDGTVTRPPTCSREGIMTYRCHSCSQIKTVAIPKTGHRWASEVIHPEGSAEEQTILRCSVCGCVQYEGDEFEYSDWSTEYPTGVDSDLIEEKTQYRYADYETTESQSSSIPGYTLLETKWKHKGDGSVEYANFKPGYDTSHWTYSKYNNSPKSNIETDNYKLTVKDTSTAGYLYWHWCYGSYEYGPINRRVDDHWSTTYPTFHAHFSTENPDKFPLDGSGNVHNKPSPDCCKDTYWYYATPVYRQTYSEYEKTYIHAKWGEWSAWSDTEVSNSENRRVETRKLYRCSNKVLRIVGNPKDFAGDYGSTAQFCVFPNKTDVTYQWYVSNDAINWAKVDSIGAQSDKLSVTLNENTANKYYRCEVKDSLGKKAVSKSAFIKSNVPVSSVKITANPESFYGYAGDKAFFSVAVEGSAASFQWEFSKDNGKTWLRTYTEGNTTTYIQPVLRENRSGQMFRCVVTDYEGNKIISKPAIMALKTSDITIVSQPKTFVGAMKDVATFHVEAKGENLKYRWMCSKDDGKTWNYTYLTGYNTDTLESRLYNHRINYQYKCVITSGGVKTVETQAAALAKKPSTAKVVVDPFDAGGFVGETATFYVAATGKDIKYQWQFSNDGGINWGDSGMAGSQTQTLNVKITNARNNYQYRCKITDDSGTAIYTKPAVLRIGPAPKFTMNTVDITAQNGTTAVFKVAASGENLKYQWQYSKDGGATWANSGASGYNTPTLNVGAAPYRDGQMYRCIVTNQYGNAVSNPALLTVK